VKVFGVTGLAGSGKSRVLRLLEARGLPVLDTDQVSRWVVDPARPEGQRGLWDLVSAFGQDILTPAGQLDRAKLRHLMVANPEVRAKLESLLHPRILEAVARVAEGWARDGAKAGFVEGTRLVESGFAAHLDGLLLVTAPDEVRRERLMARDKLGAEEATALLSIQDEGAMRRFATATLENDGDETALGVKVGAWLRREELA